MKYITSNLTKLLLILITVINIGCVGIPQKKLPIVQVEKINKEAKKPTLSYSFSSYSDVVTKTAHWQITQNALSIEFFKVLIDSGYCVCESTNCDTDLKLEIEFVQSENPWSLIPAAITGLTLYIIPSWGTVKSTVYTKATTREGKTFNYELSDSYLLVQWLPLIFAQPFYGTLSASEEVRINIWKNLIFQMQKDGILPKK